MSASEENAAEVNELTGNNALNTMKYKQLLSLVSKETSMPAELVRGICDNFLKNLATSMESYDRVKLPNLGVIKTSKSLDGRVTGGRISLARPNTESASE